MKDSNRQLYYNQTNWSVSSRCFSRYFNRNLFSTQNNDELKLVISFYTESTKQAPNDARKENAFSFLRREAGDLKIGKVEMSKTPGLMSTFGLVLF
jgi:hypothetical protein